MNKFYVMKNSLQRLIPWTWAFVWFMLPFSLKGSMAAIWLFSLLIISNIFYDRPVFKKAQITLAILPMGLFLWYLISGLLQSSLTELMPFMERKASLMFIPILMLLSQNIKGISLKWAMRGFMAGLLLAGLHLLIRAAILFLSGKEMIEWTYHGFTQPYALGAIYFSWYLLISVAYLILADGDSLIARYKTILIVFFSLLILMASSKLFVTLLIPLLIWHLVKLKLNRRQYILVSMVIMLIMISGARPFLNRLEEVRNFNQDLILQDRYEYNSPLDGISLRLIQWRLGLEIISEHNAWISGVGITETQNLLNSKYVEYNLYTGNEELGDKGYLDYNYHNQFIETMLSAGIVGLGILLLIIIATFTYYRNMLVFPLISILITILFFFTESVLERQAGILVFTMMITFAPEHKNNTIR
jgi:hypothetical protein